MVHYSERVGVSEISLWLRRGVRSDFDVEMQEITRENAPIDCFRL